MAGCIQTTREPAQIPALSGNWEEAHLSRNGNLLRNWHNLRGRLS